MTEPEIWSDDLLNRREDAEFLIAFLLNRIAERSEMNLAKSYVLNLDAAWGHGKTFFLERLHKQLSSNGYLVARTNAWRDDHADDPLLAIMAAIDKTISPLVARREAKNRSWNAIKQRGGRIAFALLKGATLHWMRRAVGEGLDDASRMLGAEPGDAKCSDENRTNDAIKESINDELGRMANQDFSAMLQAFINAKQEIEDFHSGLSDFLGGISTTKYKTPLFILVDELDRCRPSYAISLLERLKHLFDINNVVFIIATDTTQLRHAVGAVYGAGFDSSAYLRRFFDRTYTFEAPDTTEFITYLISSRPIDIEKVSLPPDCDLVQFLIGYISTFPISLRDIEQSYDMLRSVVTVWNMRVGIELSVLWPMIIASQQGLNPELSDDLIENIDRHFSQKGVMSGTCVFEFPNDDFSLNIRSSRKESFTWKNIFSQFAKAKFQPLNKLTQDSGSSLNYWVSSRFSQELALIHGNRYSSTSPPHSILRRYPAMVRGAGRLTAAT